MFADERLPDFIIGGAPRSGTTWLYELLDRHPCVHMAKPVRPEPKFFLVDEEHDKGLTYYSERWFRDVPRDVVAGEKSANYLESRLAASRIAEALPQVKLVFALRKPADRARSNFLWSVKNGLETLDFDSALRAEQAREAVYPPDLRYSRPFSYFSRGLYAELLRPYFDLFPRERILVVRFDDIAERPHDVAYRVHTFLGVSPRPEDALGIGRINQTDDENDAFRTVVHQLRERYRSANRELVAILGAEFEAWAEP